MPTTFLSLPVEIRLKIYDFVLSTSNIHSFRPQRKIGWNRPHADLSNPAVLFESDSHPALRQLFHGKLTKLDHRVILTCLLHHAKVLVADHTDFTSLQKLSSAATLPSTAVGLSAQGRSFANIVKENLRTIDFSDKLDDIHIQRYSGTIEEHVEFAKERAAPQPNVPTMPVKSTFTFKFEAESPAIQFRRMSLRSPMTDGSRMMILPAPFSTNSGPRSCHWVTVDLSMIVWQHFLYTGAPYKDHWRTVKMTTLLEAAEKRGVNVVMSFRNVEFDPSGDRGNHRHPLAWERPNPRLRGVSGLQLSGGVFRAEMSTVDWVLKLRNRNTSLEFSVRQRRKFDETASQEGCGLTRCEHRRGVLSDCESCVKEVDF
ncbi:hypothetical protein LTR70_003270 [Exophiala xenobiotica]|uniref:F-box domain-containing protein n=1 Tax=Lithohypha guttulata TaxID=1690604 RepID=A0ABR0KLU8_9EURO|nr:hypothetical protein LTR24_001145 [Lithohypha guttulata]KAK5323592.1 hypothetical protein LTR70_003270 [Exophiala xenobiotica]